MICGSGAKCQAHDRDGSRLDYAAHTGSHSVLSFKSVTVTGQARDWRPGRRRPGPGARRVAPRPRAFIRDPQRLFFKFFSLTVSHGTGSWERDTGRRPPLPGGQAAAAAAPPAAPAARGLRPAVRGSVPIIESQLDFPVAGPGVAPAGRPGAGPAAAAGAAASGNENLNPADVRA